VGIIGANNANIDKKCRYYLQDAGFCQWQLQSNCHAFRAQREMRIGANNANIDKKCRYALQSSSTYVPYFQAQPENTMFFARSAKNA
jgi:hypothetical protein